MRSSIVLAVAAAACSSGCSRRARRGAGNAARRRHGGASPARLPATAAVDAPQCTPATMQTHTSGTLTVATDSPAYEPWFVDNKPSNGKGFESAVAFAVAKQLGYSTDQVKWVVDAVQQRHRADAEEVRLRHQRGLDHAKRAPRRRLLQRLLRRRAGGRHAEEQQVRRTRRRSPTSRAPSSARSRARRASTRSTTSSSPAARRRSTRPTTSPCRR